MASFLEQLNPFIVGMVIPTGIGASIGGFAGDATPVMNLLASVSDILITHPNVANAAIFQKLPENALYVEGYALDQFFKGDWHLKPTRQNRLGIVMDSGIPEDMRIHHLNVIRAVQSVYGIDVIAIEATAKPIEIQYDILDSGCSSGQLKNPDVLLEAAKTLVEKGATAIALCVFFPQDHLDNATESQYKDGIGVDPVGGIEAILSHTIVSQLQIPCANSPVFDREAAMPEFEELIDGRSAAEYLAPTFLPCVLQGLNKAPSIETEPNRQTISISQLSALVTPIDALGGIPVLAALAQGIPIIAVQENTTVCNIRPEHFASNPTPIYQVSSYAEATGLLQAIKHGIARTSLGFYPHHHTSQTASKPEVVRCSI